MSDSTDKLPVAVKAEVNKAPESIGMVPWRKNLRLYSGLILFIFAAGHLGNHAVGLVSLEAMEQVRQVRTYIWRNPIGTVLLFGALMTHVYLALHKFALRRTWRMSRAEAVQLCFGLVIPVLLLPHIFGTRLANELFGLQDNYEHVLSVLWSGNPFKQSLLMVLVWVHGCIGMHFWLRLKPWYARTGWLLYGFAVVLPALSFAGFAVAGRRLVEQDSHVSALSVVQREWIYSTADMATWLSLSTIIAVVTFRLLRSQVDRFGPTIKVSYADGRTVTSQLGPTLLDISRLNKVPHASVCGGRARCSTCRVRVLEGLEAQHPPGETERKVLKRVGAGANVRLACQLSPRSDIRVATILPAHGITVSDAAPLDRYFWGVDQSVTILFADIRGFTAMSENKLPYDVVFILNQYLGQMSTAISDSGGYVDKFLGDGIMAIFGMEKRVELGVLDALNAARAMGRVLDSLNVSLEADLEVPLNIGIGIHTGPAILGRIGVAGASGATQQITALGDTVNTASRLEGACKELACQLVVSEASVRASKLPITGGHGSLISVKGRGQQVGIQAFSNAKDLQVGASEV
ncbi:adenylate/guanylate cyclase domain-containing protein [Granulosicoccus antarcticus]|uniref:Adenylate cyclase 1 n=1 Tax=Granulosicoccus antarcticus IMCC3135 TaxID=1192854 RepID=A0A2Z2NQP9_9GAMM|nr:adenylate/guanylate cyclase domain-containing protein [Granulosicoccus antarcticus]ASJ73806.1 Adenylate cyclase 1 [Granulosicoccus antarcticus IMCC3135]